MTARLLVIEDDDAVRGVIQAQMSQAGFAVTAADSGEAAVTALRAEPGAFAAIVCDVALPGMTGPEALAAAGDDALGRAGVVFLSGLSHPPKIVLPGRKAAQLEKPFEPAALLAQVKAVAAS